MTTGSQGNDQVLALFQRDPGTPFAVQDIEGYRAFAASASDQEIIDLVEVVRRWWATIADFSPHQHESETDTIGIVDRPTLSAAGGSQDIGGTPKVTLPRTAAEIIELVRRAPEIFNKFSPAERLEAIRVTTSKRYRERLELVQEVTALSNEESQGTNEQPIDEGDVEDRVQHWFHKRSDELPTHMEGIERSDAAPSPSDKPEMKEAGR